MITRSRRSSGSSLRRLAEGALTSGWRSADWDPMSASLGVVERVRRVAGPVHRYNRLRKLEFVAAAVERHDIRSVLVVGVHGNSAGASFNNVLERGLGELVPKMVLSGLAPHQESFGSDYVQADGLDLPFEAGEFDLVFSNAVVEHVGDRDAQLRFLAEHDRVGAHWIATTPNRAFPVESHRHTLFTHWSDRFYARNQNISRLLTPRSFAEILPGRGRIVGGWHSMTLTAATT